VLRAEKPVCSGCGARGLQVKEHREKRWRALDLGGLRCVIECRLRRLYCPGCGDVYEAVPWARAGAKYTREFDDLAAVVGAADEPDPGHEAAADRLEVGRQHP
jgi:transposase